MAERVVTSAAAVSADRVRADVLAFGLPGSSPRAHGRLDEATFAELMDWARRENVVGLLWHASHQLFDLDTAHAAQLHSEYADLDIETLSIEATALDVKAALDAAGIQFRVLKGLATANLLYPRPSWRAFRDLDVVVRPHQLDQAIEALVPITAEGAEVQAGPTRTAMMKERQITDVRGVAIDVHRSVQGSLVTTSLPVEAVFDAPRQFQLEAATFQAPSAVVMFVHAVLHSSSGGAQQSTLPDVARLALLADADDAVIADLLAESWVRDLFTWSLSRAATLVPIPERWTTFCDEHRPSDRHRRMLDLIHRDEARLGLANVLIGGQRLRRSFEVLWPSTEYLDYHDITRTDNWRWILHRGWQAITR